MLALAAALLFGISTPFLQRAGVGVGPFTTAALLYGGAALMGALLRQPVHTESRLRRADGRRLLAMALLGAVVGPVALAWGLQQMGGTVASLLLALEALFTVVLARLLYGEVMDRRVWAAMLLLLAGGLLLVADAGRLGTAQVWGVAAVLLATAAWGLDNTLSRALAERDPAQVVLGKSALGATAAAALAWAAQESLPGGGAVAGLLLIGALGYGLSLRLYLLAQRALGAARTGSVFAFAPFIGAVAAAALGDRSGTWMAAAAGGLMLLGVALHLVESHDHVHHHLALEHEHAHSHGVDAQGREQGDGHHHHQHTPEQAKSALSTKAHSHPHQHEPQHHRHPHLPDAHHQHSHE